MSYKNKNISKLNEKAKAQIRADDFGFVFQQSNLVSSLTMAENVRVAGYAGGKFTRSEIDDRTEKLFTQMNMTEIMNNLPSEVSGGEAQRTAIARAVINSPEIIFADELNSLDEVKKVNTQKLIFTDYTVNGEKSDSQGQLIAYTPDKSGYKFFNDDLNGRINAPNKISDDEVYVSASMKSIYGTKIGDIIDFTIARNGGTVSLKVSGFYEDVIMGSLMIGMKGFLISENNYSVMSEQIGTSGIDALAKTGAMIHIDSTNGITSAELNKIINERTSIEKNVEFMHSFTTIKGFMTVLQNTFSVFVIAFSVVLILAVFIIIGHSISSVIMSDYSDMGNLKTLGLTSANLRMIQLVQYGFAVVPAIIIGIVLTIPTARLVDRIMITSSGVLFEIHIPMLILVITYLSVLIILALFVMLKTRKISRISLIQAMQNTEVRFRKNKISGTFSLVIRQLSYGRKHYISICIVSVLLVFFSSMAGRMNSWLGADGKGMMDAFNPAGHDIGVQIFGDFSAKDTESIINGYTRITDTYDLAMPDVSVEGINYTANVITDPSRFHIISGQTCNGDSEIVITEFIAENFGVTVGGTLKVSADKSSEKYVVSGIYSCANDMGNNIGMSRDGYLKIGSDDPKLWCHHYFLEDSEKKAEIKSALEKQFGGDVHVHENTWSGLLGIILAMHGFIILIYLLSIVFIVIVTAMTLSRIMYFEQRDIGIFKAIGYSSGYLRKLFSLRIMAVSAIGSAVGTILAMLVSDYIVSAVLKLEGISNYSASPNTMEVLIPPVFVIVVFTSFGYIFSGKIKHSDISILTKE